MLDLQSWVSGVVPGRKSGSRANKQDRNGAAQGHKLIVCPYGLTAEEQWENDSACQWVPPCIAAKLLLTACSGEAKHLCLE